MGGVRVYRNLHRVSGGGDPVYSVQGRVGGVWRVTGYASFVLLRDVVFRVMESGRRRTLGSGQKCVHAFVYGELLSSAMYPSILCDGSLVLDSGECLGGVRVSYNPYVGSSFYRRDGGDSVSGGRYAVIGRFGIVVYF